MGVGPGVRRRAGALPRRRRKRTGERRKEDLALESVLRARTRWGRVVKPAIQMTRNHTCFEILAFWSNLRQTAGA